MEHTPFDCSLPEVTSRVEARLPPSMPIEPRKKRPSWVLIGFLCLMVLGAGGAGAGWYHAEGERRAQETQLKTWQDQVSQIVLKDNALVMEMLDESALRRISYAEFFKRAERNREERDALIRELRALQVGPFEADKADFIKLMARENEWVRTEEATSRAALNVAANWEVYTEANDNSTQAAQKLNRAREAYLIAPYGYDYSELVAYRISQSRLTGATETAQAAFKSWSESVEELTRERDQAIVSISDWIREEALLYPSFVAPRDIENLLRAKKLSYTNGGAFAEETPPLNQSQSSDNGMPLRTISATPTATPRPVSVLSSPTRVHSTQPLDGERFSETRMQDLSAEWVATLSDDDLRYAINEMYARYGLVFRNRSIQANFDGTSWYNPESRWTASTIERVFNRREKSNLHLLNSERGRRRS